FYKAVERLAAHRHGQIIRLDPDHLAAFGDALRQRPPRYVAVVLRPERLDYDFARRFLAMATQMDDDPFVDLSYGFITGATAEEAAAFVERGIKAEQTKRQPDLGSISVWGISKSQLVRSKFPLRNRTIPQLEGRLASPEDLIKQGRDTHFIKEFLTQLSGKSLVIFG